MGHPTPGAVREDTAPAAKNSSSSMTVPLGARALQNRPSYARNGPRLQVRACEGHTARGAPGTTHCMMACHPRTCVPPRLPAQGRTSPGPYPLLYLGIGACRLPHQAFWRARGSRSRATGRVERRLLPPKRSRIPAASDPDAVWRTRLPASLRRAPGPAVRRAYGEQPAPCPLRSVARTTHQKTGCGRLRCARPTP